MPTESSRVCSMTAWEVVTVSCPRWEVADSRVTRISRDREDTSSLHMDSPSRTKVPAAMHMDTQLTAVSSRILHPSKIRPAVEMRRLDSEISQEHYNRIRHNNRQVKVLAAVDIKHSKEKV